MITIDRLSEYSGKEIVETYFCEKVVPCMTKDGARWLSVTVSDATGRAIFRVWQERIREEYLKMEDCFARISGKAEYYNGAYYVAVTSMEPVEETAVDLARYAKSIQEESLKECREAICQAIDGMRSESLKALVNGVYAMRCKDRTVIEHFMTLPAGGSHHMLNGGLLLHTMEVVKLSRLMGELSPEGTDMDLLMAGALLHDVGRVTEYRPLPHADMTKRGRLVGHVAEAVAMLACINGRSGSKYGRFQELLHIVSACGEDEKACTKEAMIVSLADRASIQMSGYDTAFERYDIEHPGDERDAIWSQTLGKMIIR